MRFKICGGFYILKEIVSGIYQIDTHALGHKQIIAAYLVIGNKKSVFIDPGFSSSVEKIVQVMNTIGFEIEQLDYIALTHTHMDHAGGVGVLLKKAKNTQILVHSRGAFYLRNSIKISGGAQMIFGSLMEEMGEVFDIPAQRIQMIGEGDSIDLGDKKLSVFYSPGHSGDHISFFEEETGTLFAGDSACLNYPQLGNVLIPSASPPIYLTEQVIEESKRFLQLKVNSMLTPHFGKPGIEASQFLESNIQAVMNTRNRIKGFLADRREFFQIVEALRSDIFKQSSIQQEEIPKFFSEVWLRLMLKTGLMGYMADILQYARDIRPFYETTSN